MSLSSDRYACPCCGYRTLALPSPGSWLTCEVCGWTDEGRENVASEERLFVAQREFVRTGRSWRDAEGHVRAPRPEEAREAEWRPMEGVPEGMSPREKARAELVAAIEEAFAGVSPEGRVTLRDAYRADCYRETTCEWDDHDTDWRKIPDEVLEYFGRVTNVFIFGNAISFRYYLPAYMRLELRKQSVDVVVHALDLRRDTAVPFLEREEVRLLDRAQRQAVVAYLQHVIAFEWNGERPTRALERVWLPSLSS